MDCYQQPMLLSVLQTNLLVLDYRIRYEIFTVQIFQMHMNCSYLAVIVGFIVINPFVCTGLAAGKQSLPQ